MAQDNQTAQPSEASVDNSSQPEVALRDLDQGGEDGVKTTPEEMISPVTDTPETVNDSPDDDLRKQLEELKSSNDNLKKGLYDKGREMKDLKDALINAVPESEQQMADTSADDAELDAATAVLKERGFVDADVLNAFEKRMEQKSEVTSILNANPQIDKEVLDALMAKDSNLHIYDVIEKYKGTLLGDTSLQKAHSRPLMGEPIAKVAIEEKNISQMSDDEFNLMLKKKSGSNGGRNYI